MRGSEARANRSMPGQPRHGRDAVSPRKPTAVDRHVGSRLRLLRRINNMSLERLAETPRVC